MSIVLLVATAGSVATAGASGLGPSSAHPTTGRAGRSTSDAVLVSRAGYRSTSGGQFTAASSSIPVSRIFGGDAIGTAIAVSQTEFPTPGSAKAVVLARSDFFSDALAGGPLAATSGGPLLITPGASESSSLDQRVQAEIQRVLPPGGVVYILGGSLALSPNIDSTLQGLGYSTQRVAGSDEFATAVDVAELLGNPSTVFEATGTDFADALSAGPAAIKSHGAILLTDGNQQAPETASYLAQHTGDTRYAIGGTFAAAGADPSAKAIYGQDLYGTSAAVASTFFPGTAVFGAATGASFQDSLSGGVFLGAPTSTGPMLLVEPSGALPPSIASYLAGVTSTLTQGYLFGGPLAVGNDVQSELETPQGSSPPPASLAVTTTSLPGGIVNAPYSATLSASSGTPPYSWTIASGSLPPGLSLSASGAVTGTPIDQGTSSFTVAVTDSSTPISQTATQALSISIGASQVQTVTSANWSGYAFTSGPYSQVTGTFNVPRILPPFTTPSEITAEWLGIDGFPDTNHSLIQAGVQEIPTSPSTSQVQAWWEILPAPETPITAMDVSSGDTVTVTIGRVSASEWGITLTDDTNGQSFTTDQGYSGPLSSAEWIVESPSAGTELDLAPYTPAVSFSGLSAAGTESTLTRIVMDQNGQQVSTPSSYSSAGFAVAYGSTAPPAPQLRSSGFAPAPAGADAPAGAQVMVGAQLPVEDSVYSIRSSYWSDSSHSGVTSAMCPASVTKSRSGRIARSGRWPVTSTVLPAEAARRSGSS